MLEKQLEIGKQAVIEAMRLTRTVQQELTGEETITKKDRSPVTIADYAAQAVVCRLLNTRFPGIPIVGEERAEALKQEENREIFEKIVHYIESDEKINGVLNRDNLLESIDLGGDEAEGEMFWTLDPVDGTKGFLRGEQYAIALALIEKGEVKLGILGCPNMVLPGNDSRGYLLYAIEGQGAKMVCTADGSETGISVSGIDNPKEMRFVESYVSAHSNQDLQLEIARTLEIAGDPVRLDSQVKYGILASGNAEIYLRIPNPKTPDYKEKIWDHAAGSIVIREAGGVVTDIFGAPLDFAQGKTLKNNSGICASVPSIHPRIVEIIRQKQ